MPRPRPGGRFLAIRAPIPSEWPLPAVPFQLQHDFLEELAGLPLDRAADEAEVFGQVGVDQGGRASRGGGACWSRTRIWASFSRTLGAFSGNRVT